MKYAWLGYIASFALHIALGVVVSGLEVSEAAPVPVRIELFDAPEVAEPPEPPPLEEELPPPPEVEEAPVPQPTRTPPPTAPPVEAAAPAEAPPLLLGASLSNTSGPGGLAVPIGDPRGVAPDKAPKTRKGEERTLAAAEPKAKRECVGEPVKAKPLSVPQPDYTEDARAAGVEGRVRVEVQIGPDGSLTKAKILASLHPGLDESALRAVHSGKYEAAQECGKPTSGTITISIRFTL